ncbi:hypothetical protein ERX46_02960 [Brumimicrobium glaciale]|uniref:Uncharacterized protein n=1 Tax=Brumimicrobium glaciale TaxID=200475 RepID=A0A4Q4KSM2_9FLAO|nr:hypothetical protein [Brumimicrobium glaciale]RYM35972.1 hypothetical protein ERX46_02960 [Brumimicrobium glaciale]
MNRLKLVNAISEAVIPILGLVFFEWGIYFILLFYFIDLIATEVFVYIKVNKIIQFQKINFPFSLRYGRLIFNSILMFLVIIISQIAVYFIVPGIDFPKQIVAFLSYEEAGLPIPQGYILLPLVILGNYQQYKAMFVKTGAYQIQSWKNLIFSRRKALYIAIAGGILAIGLANLIALPGFVYVLVIVGVKFWLDFFND